MVLLAVAILLGAAFLGTFFITGHERKASVVEGVAGSAVAPAMAGASGATNSVKGFFQRLFGTRDVDKEYAELKTRVQMLEMENQLMQDLQKELERQSKLLGYEEKIPDYSCLPAHVIGKEPGSWFMNFTLDRGSAQGVQVDNAVVNEDGLVGRVVSVGPTWCKVMGVIDRQSAVPAVVERSRDNCTVKGSGDPEGTAPDCGINYLPYDSEIVPGDKVLTTDLGGVFPKGLLIGTVTEVSREQPRYATLLPAVDFARLEDVLIIKGGKNIPTEDEIKAYESKAADTASATPSASPSPSPSPTGTAK